MDHLLDEVEAALDAQLWLLAVTGAFLIPDVAAALRDPSGHTTGSRYQAWFSEYLGVAYEGYLSAEDAWLYRCSLTHQGYGGHPRAETERVLLLPPGPTIMHKIRMGGEQSAVALDVIAFVKDMVGIGRGWLNAHRTDPVVASNLTRSVRLHPNGIAPFIVGCPIIG